MEKAKDPLTGETFTKRRHNQVFASRANQCRYNNIKAREKRRETAVSRGAVEKNRGVLKRLYEAAPKRLYSKDYLLGAGLHFGYFTHCVQHGGALYRFAHDYGFAQAGDGGMFKLAKSADVG